MQLAADRLGRQLLVARGHVKGTAAAAAGAGPRTRPVVDCSREHALPLARWRLHRRHE